MARRETFDDIMNRFVVPGEPIARTSNGYMA